MPTGLRGSVNLIGHQRPRASFSDRQEPPRGYGTLFEETQELDIQAVISSAYDEVAALEAKWKAPPQPKTENQTLLGARSSR